MKSEKRKRNEAEIIQRAEGSTHDNVELVNEEDEAWQGFGDEEVDKSGHDAVKTGSTVTKETNSRSSKRGKANSHHERLLGQSTAKGQNAFAGLKDEDLGAEVDGMILEYLFAK